MALKYMLMLQVMCNQAEDVASLISSKGGLKRRARPWTR